MGSPQNRRDSLQFNATFETLLREEIIPSFVLGKRRVVDRLELDRYVERRNDMARTESSVPEKEEIIVSLEK